MKRLYGKHGPLVLLDKTQVVRYWDDWSTGDNPYFIEYSVKLLLDRHGFSWMISGGDWVCSDKRLSDCALTAARMMTENDPRYERLVSHLFEKDMWSKL